jgi:hypothetical protein
MYPANRSQRMLSDARHALAPVQKIALAVRALPVVQPEERGKEVAGLEKIESLCVTRQVQTERLKFYLDRLAASGAEHICMITKQSAAELTSQARKPSNNAYFARW